MHAIHWARAGYLKAEADPYAAAFAEVFEQLGVQFEKLPSLPEQLSDYNVLFLGGYGQLEEDERTSVEGWVAAGGVLICCGSSWGLDALLGLQGPPKHKSKGYLTVASAEDRLWPDFAANVAFFGGSLYDQAAEDTNIVCLVDEAVGVTRRRVDDGSAYFICAHIGQSVTLMQMGRSVETDGIGPSDGSACLDDGFLRAEDGVALSFREDRQTVDESDCPFFGEPYCDALKDLLARVLFEGIEQSGLAMPLVWHWPNNANAVACISLDCTNYDPAPIDSMTRLLGMSGAKACWLVGLPGYPLDVYRALKARGDEVGLMFQAEDQLGWTEDKMKIQHLSVGRSCVNPNLVSARPSDGRWHGWIQFYGLSEEAGSRLSLSKGGRQPGTSGFLFGTSRPFFPLRKDGTPFLAGELPYCVFRPGASTPEPVSKALLAKTAASFGCYHIVSTPQSADDPTESAALRQLVAQCRHANVQFLLPEQIYRFERKRRQLKLGTRCQSGGSSLILASDTTVEGLTILLPSKGLRAWIKERNLPLTQVRRYGAAFYALTLDLEAKQLVEIQMSSSPARVAA
jgi:hypothetical protein